ncbi:hypothetical protein Q7C36_007053 [Tachysurus vachellii]|uniref:Uncharacterized protein n=1 Tax=Tachysurus vachellii TaxID=175792 RepID=A0AA88T036_TACVA|nr:hypothetical protein Q7C36_007053 [Tachysurus vachellii]
MAYKSGEKQSYKLDDTLSETVNVARARPHPARVESAYKIPSARNVQVFPASTDKSLCFKFPLLNHKKVSYHAV